MFGADGKQIYPLQQINGSVDLTLDPAKLGDPYPPRYLTETDGPYLLSAGDYLGWVGGSIIYALRFVSI